MEIIYEPSGKAKEYSPLAVNLYQGCEHRCKYCFGPQILRKNREVFHSDCKPKEDALAKLTRDAEKLGKAGNEREILLCFVTDPYQTIESELNITRQAIETLIKNNLRFTILTKGGIRAARDFDLLKNYDKASFGSTICFTKQDDADKWEPNAPSIDMRIEAIKAAHEMGIRTWVSLEPVINPDQALELIEEIHPFVDHWKVGKLNYQNLKVDWLKFRDDVTGLLESVSADYYLKKSLTDIKESKKKNPPKFVSIAANVNSKEAEDACPWTEGVIPTRKGNCNILVIAPHGNSNDDTGTYQLARQLADNLDCYAVVNDKYRKPENVKASEKYEVKYQIDLNYCPEIEKSAGAMKDFIGPIKEFKKQILKKYDSLFILHIHGIGDTNRKKVAKLLSEFKDRPEDLHLLIGYGQHQTYKKRKTADVDKIVNPLIVNFQKNGLYAVMAPTEPIIVKKGKKDEKRWYCGNDKRRLNQELFKDKVQSLQLEFKKGGLRDKSENINKTSINLANAIKAIWETEIPEENQHLPAPAASKPDLDKVYTKLMAIVSEGFENTMLDAGRYLIDTFYGGDPRVALEDKKKQSLNSLNKHIIKLREKNPGAPGKSWIYNAVNLVIEHETIKAHSDELFHTYGQLPLSHKVLLLETPI